MCSFLFQLFFYVATKKKKFLIFIYLFKTTKEKRGNALTKIKQICQVILQITTEAKKEKKKKIENLNNNSNKRKKKLPCKRAQFQKQSEFQRNRINLFSGDTQENKVVEEGKKVRKKVGKKVGGKKKNKSKHRSSSLYSRKKKQNKKKQHLNYKVCCFHQCYSPFLCFKIAKATLPSKGKEKLPQKKKKVRVKLNLK
ncbi:hypothetical protein RFI_15743 [Reticulomyxa filosa]|uniref:Uncharacterized protein n=1 Tax=Reticulomyxa filosa TaxID=46433 RepID=X6N6C2_RETFI|nr:hypothetical protein RFI_15743 [Reticulomyxa filosa]|eukprot:ETO21463.1 hypothetical protein RFI_15743 [Reticulomyxa filosa]